MHNAPPECDHLVSAQCTMKRKQRKQLQNVISFLAINKWAFRDNNLESRCVVTVDIKQGVIL